jgi:hypothetical protein
VIDVIGTVVLFIAFTVLAIAVVHLARIQQRKWQESFALLARQLRVEYSPEIDQALPNQYAFLNRIAQGEERHAANVLRGVYRGHEVEAFDYHYTETTVNSKGELETQQCSMGFFILRLGRSFPELHIFPESFLSRIGQALGSGDIDFESVEFSRAFTVESNNKKFAYDVCNVRMMAHLLSDPGIAIEIENDCLALTDGWRLDPDTVMQHWNRLVAVRELMPDYLFAE